MNGLRRANWGYVRSKSAGFKVTSPEGLALFNGFVWPTIVAFNWQCIVKLERWTADPHTLLYRPYE